MPADPAILTPGTRWLVSDMDEFKQFTLLAAEHDMRWSGGEPLLGDGALIPPGFPSPAGSIWIIISIYPEKTMRCIFNRDIRLFPELKAYKPRVFSGYMTPAPDFEPASGDEFHKLLFG